MVTLLRTINDEWIEGRIGCRQGMFPANYITIKVPLAGYSTNIVQALYTFQGETWEDLSFRVIIILAVLRQSKTVTYVHERKFFCSSQEGDKIEVLSRISDDWLYGECNSSKGQFPANYIDRLPENLPAHS